MMQETQGQIAKAAFSFALLGGTLSVGAWSKGVGDAVRVDICREDAYNCCMCLTETAVCFESSLGTTCACSGNGLCPPGCYSE